MILLSVLVNSTVDGGHYDFFLKYTNNCRNVYLIFYLKLF